MSGTVRIYNLAVFYLLPLHIIDLKLCGFSKMLKYIAIFIRYCNSHDTVSFAFAYLLHRHIAVTVRAA